MGVPDWAKLAATVAAATVGVVLWATNNFVSRAEMTQHMEQQSKDFSRVVNNQETYAQMERGTAANLSNINARLTGIEAKMEILLEGIMSAHEKNNAKHKAGN